MAAYILYDAIRRENMYPFSLTRPIADCRLGIFTLREKWERYLGKPTSTLTEDYLKEKFSEEKEGDNYWINAGLIPDEQLISAMNGLRDDSSLVSGNHILISRGKHFPHNTSLNNIIYEKDYSFVTYPWELLHNNEKAIQQDFNLLVGNPRQLDTLNDIKLTNAENIFIEEGAMINAASINASQGPVYIGKNANLMEGSHLYGPIAIGEGAVVKMGAKIYGATTVGPYSTVGGEVKNSILFGYSNKAHDGYLGDSIIGEWCNLGAGTSNSNLKNTAGTIEIKRRTGLKEVGTKCGFFMGDFSRTAIQSRINSGTVIGVSAHLHHLGFPSKEIPSFYWDEENKYQLEKVLHHADNWMKLKGKRLDKNWEKILSYLYKQNN